MPDEPPLEATRPPALTRPWWLTAVRGLVHKDLLVRLLGVSADLTGVLRVLGGFASRGSSDGVGR